MQAVTGPQFIVTPRTDLNSDKPFEVFQEQPHVVVIGAESSSATGYEVLTAHLDHVRTLDCFLDAIAAMRASGTGSIVRRCSDNVLLARAGGPR